MLRAVILSLALAAGCATTRGPAPAPETVGTLAPSYHSVAVAPVHAGTDLSPGFQAVSSDADGDCSSFSTSNEAAKEEVTEPDVAPKAGLVMGGAR